MPGDDVRWILEDRLENLWFGTYGSGVSRYDGVNWRTFTTADGLPNNAVLSILEDREGNLWFATDGGGVSRFDGSTWRTFTTADGLVNNYVHSIVEDRSGNLWFGGGGVSQYDGSTWRTFTTADGLASNAVGAAIEDRSGNLWFGTDRGASRFDGSTWRTFTTADGLAGRLVESIMEDRSGNLWFGTYGSGVSRYDGSTWRTFTTADGLADNFVFSALEDRFGNLWLGTARGASRYDGSNWKTFRAVDGLASDRVYSGAILEDRSGNLWFGTLDGGASRYDGSSWKTFTTADGLAYNSLNSILEDRSGNLWFGTSLGASRYDGKTWTTFTTIDGLASNVRSILQDRSENLWFATLGNGVSRFDGSAWMTFTMADGLANPYVESILEDRSGNLWFGTLDGVSQYDGTTWRTFTTADGLAGNRVSSMLEDRSGDLWFGTYDGGVSRFDGSAWRTFTTSDGLASNNVQSMFEDRSGNLWFGTGGAGASRYDGSAWRTFTSDDGLASDLVDAILEDRSGNLWFGTYGGVSRYDGSAWRTFRSGDGLASDQVVAILEDRSGNLWFGTNGAGVSIHEPDHVSPQTVFLSAPPRLSPLRTQTAAFVAAFGEGGSVEFSYRLDSSDSNSWSPWSPIGSWFLNDVPDGIHVLEVRSRDFLNNIDRTPARANFEVDATPPSPVIEEPAFGQAVRATVPIRGTAADARFTSYVVAVRLSGVATWNAPDTTILAQSITQVGQGLLASWDTNTTRFPDGLYDLRLSVADALGLTGNVQVTVVVDNHFPFAEETAPAKVTAAVGGDLYTTNQELHLYFPPHAFDQDVLVSIARTDSVPETLPSGVTRVLALGYDISWSGGTLRKPATLEFSTAGRAPMPGALAVYSSPDGIAWQRLGGTPEEGKVSLAVRGPGRYAVFTEAAPPAGNASLSALSFTPRVFSVADHFANDHVAIGFTLGKPASVTVRIYNRAGRLVNEVVSGQTMGTGANMVRWDGRDRAGVFVADGIYLVTVEALGQRRKNTLAVVR